MKAFKEAGYNRLLINSVKVVSLGLTTASGGLNQ